LWWRERPKRSGSDGGSEQQTHTPPQVAEALPPSGRAKGAGARARSAEQLELARQPAAAAAALCARLLAADAAPTPAEPAAAAASGGVDVCTAALAALAPRGEDPAALASEFSSILMDEERELHLSDHRCIDGSMEGNAHKNRYCNILPFDANRVRLPAPAAGAGGAVAARRGAAAGAGRGARLFEAAACGGGGGYFNGSYIQV
jgi:hypothetical protein